MRYPIHARVVVVSYVAFALSLVGGARTLAQCPSKLVPSGGPEPQHFGCTVAIDGDVAAVGISGPYDQPEATGLVFVYRFDGVNWVEEQQLVSDDINSYDSFGLALDVFGEMILVGAWGHDEVGTGAGAAYVFRYDGSAWRQEAKLLASDGEPMDYFGWSVALAGDVAVIGARNDDDISNGGGSAYVFRFDGAAWVEEAKLLPDDVAVGASFGHSVALHGDTIVVGAPGDDPFGDTSGSAFVFRYTASGWVREQELLASDGSQGDEFGNAAAVHADMVVIGAGAEDHLAFNAGAAYVFQGDDAAWNEVAKLVASDAAPFQRFADALDFDGNVLVIGAEADGELGERAGAAYVFHSDGSDWVQDSKLLPAVGEFWGQFGTSVSVSSGIALIAANYEDAVGVDSGAAYIFHLCRGDLNGDGYRNAGDLALFAAAYGSQAGDGDYSPLADIVCDGFVNITDFTAFAGRYGTGCP